MFYVLMNYVIVGFSLSIMDSCRTAQTLKFRTKLVRDYPRHKPIRINSNYSERVAQLIPRTDDRRAIFESIWMAKRVMVACPIETKKLESGNVRRHSMIERYYTLPQKI